MISIKSASQNAEDDPERPSSDRDYSQFRAQLLYDSLRESMSLSPKIGGNVYQLECISLRTTGSMYGIYRKQAHVDESDTVFDDRKICHVVAFSKHPHSSNLMTIKSATEGLSDVFHVHRNASLCMYNLEMGET